MTQSLADANVRISHLIDDHETVRTHAKRTIADQYLLLIDALHAVRNGSYATAEEFIDRAMTALYNESEWLAGRIPTGTDGD
jgi:Flp pilus assembly protein TadD